MTGQAEGRPPRHPRDPAPSPSPPGGISSRPSAPHPPAAALTDRRLRFRVASGGGEVPPPAPFPARPPPAAEGGKRRRPWVTSTRCRGRASPPGSWRSTSGSPSASWGASRRSAGRLRQRGRERRRRPGAAAGGLGAGREADGYCGKELAEAPELWRFQVPLERKAEYPF